MEKAESLQRLSLLQNGSSRYNEIFLRKLTMMKKINLTLCVCLLGLVLIGMTFAGCSKEKVQESPQGPWEIVCYFYMDDTTIEM